MGTWTITTTTAEDDAIQYAYQQALKQPAGRPPPLPPVTVPATVEAFFQQQTMIGTVAPMVTAYQQARNVELVSMLGTIPPENRPAAQAAIEDVVEDHGGTVTARELAYLWSTNTAAPPRNNSAEADVSAANLATIRKLTFDHRDADGVDRMASLMALATSTLIRLEAGANMLQVVTTAAPVQRQGADGYVEFAVQFSQSAGTLADTARLAVTFT
jgi:hypothetical protein